MSHITKAVIPAAGLGTRFLPVTKSIPKEMLPVIDKPAIQYVVEEAAAAGLNDLLMVTGRNKRTIEDHFDRNVELDTVLRDKEDLHRLNEVTASDDMATMHYIRQGVSLGLGHAVLRAAEHVGNDPFAVLLSDDLIDPRDPLLPAMLAAHETYGGSIVALMQVPDAEIHRYGCAAISPDSAADIPQLTGLVEKPHPAAAPSNLAVIGRYVLSPEVFKVLRNTPAGVGGEIQLTDALQHMTSGEVPGGPVHGVVFDGRRYDTGDRGEYLQTLVRLACERDDLGVDFREWLRKFAATEI